MAINLDHINFGGGNLTVTPSGAGGYECGAISDFVLKYKVGHKEVFTDHGLLSPATIFNISEQLFIDVTFEEEEYKKLELAVHLDGTGSSNAVVLGGIKAAKKVFALSFDPLNDPEWAGAAIIEIYTVVVISEAIIPFLKKQSRRIKVTFEAIKSSGIFGYYGSIED